MDRTHGRRPGAHARHHPGDGTTSAAGTAVHDLLGTAISLIPAAQAVSVLLTDPRDGLRRWVSSAPLAEVWDDLQLTVHEGPGWECNSTGANVFVDDLRSDESGSRWPALAGTAPAEVRSVMALRLAAAGRQFGCLELHSSLPAAFDDTAHRTAEVVAVLGAQTVVAVLQADQLLSAIDRRDVIGQAKGIIMERVQLDADEAFDVLRGISNRTNAKLVDVARDIVLRRTTTTGQAASRSQQTARSAKRMNRDLVEDHHPRS